MFKTRVMEATDGGNSQLPYAEMDPNQRYGRFKDVLGKGAMKTVYRAFDEFLGMEVAWNQVKINDAFGSPEELQRLKSEVHLLKNLNHISIMKSRASWIDCNRRTFNFITEMFTSGTLREYRKRYSRVNIRAIKDWARQILEGLNYLHCHNPPVIHRDLKCDNIFVNGHLGEVKIGDLGLAAILRGSCHAHSVIGTPEFMAPELYEEDYDELVDIYSFGMCVLEMLTSEYPYSECTNPAQIYKKVTMGKLPHAYFKIEDTEASRFVGRCLEKASNRPSARELLMDPFLLLEDPEELHAISITPPEASHSARNTGMTITGTMNSEDDTIFLKVQHSDKNGRARHIYFPFDIASDTPLDVATEMVKELEILDLEPFEIADMIEKEISALVPSWKNPSFEMNHQHSFNYDDQNYDDEDITLRHPFYCTSSLSSSEASLPGLPPLNEPIFHQETSLSDWLQEESIDHDDASSDISSMTYSYSNLKYCSGNEDESLPISPRENQRCDSRAQKSTRFCPQGDREKNNAEVVRTQSLVDIRSQLLHRSLVDEINKRRLFNTVGAVENIGFRDPCMEMMSGVSSGRSGRRGPKRV